MLRLPERRRELGVALLTDRVELLRPRLYDAGIANRAFLLQDDEKKPLPDIRSPLLLDTVGLALPDLFAVLLAVQREAITTLALVNPSDIRLHRLLPLCAAVRVIISDAIDLAHLPPFTRHLDDTPQHGAALPPVWVGLRAPPQLTPPLSPQILRLLNELPCCKDHDMVAAACGMSRATLMRLLADARKALGMPAGTSARYRPPVLATAILAALAES
jgi:hypothetical protein